MLIVDKEYFPKIRQNVFRISVDSATLTVLVGLLV